MEIIGEIIGQFIGEIFIGFTKTIVYKLIARPVLIAFGFIISHLKNLFLNDIKPFKLITYDEFEKESGDFIIGSLVITLLLSIVFMIAYFGFYVFNN